MASEKEPAAEEEQGPRHGEKEKADTERPGRRQSPEKALEQIDVGKTVHGQDEDEEQDESKIAHRLGR